MDSVPSSPEEWRHIEGYEGKYSVSSWGRVAYYNHRGVRVPLKGQRKTGFYHYVHLYKPGHKRKAFRVHRLVAIAFIPNPDNLPEVNHIDGDVWRNDRWNLEWASSSENIRDMYARRGTKHLLRKYVRHT